MELNAEQQRWIKSLKKTIQAMPNGIEMIIGFDSLDILPDGSIKELENKGFDMLSEGARFIEGSSLSKIRFNGKRIRPNSEGI